MKNTILFSHHCVWKPVAWLGVGEQGTSPGRSFQVGCRRVAQGGSCTALAAGTAAAMQGADVAGSDGRGDCCGSSSWELLSPWEDFPLLSTLPPTLQLLVRPLLPSHLGTTCPARSTKIPSCASIRSKHVACRNRNA